MIKTEFLASASGILHKLSRSKIMVALAVIAALPLIFGWTLLSFLFAGDKGAFDKKSGGATTPPPAAPPAPASEQAEAPEVGETAREVLRAASLHHVVQIDDAVVNFGVFVGDQPKITRLVKVRGDRLPWQRARIAFRRQALPDFTPAVAQARKVPFSLEGAIACTRRDLKGLDASIEPAGNAGVERAIPVVDFNADAAADQKAATRPTVATGRVTSIGTVKVTPTGRKPYSSFQIVVDSGSSRAVFTGVDLQEKFNSGVFGMHDVIHIEKNREDFEVDEGGGTRSKRQKNTYKIEVLERAQN